MLENQVKRKQFTEAQIREILTEVEQGGRLVDTCRKFGFSPTSYYRWRDARLKSAAGVGVLEYQRLAEEHSRLKRMYGELALRYNMLSEARR
ncbi:MULTISPECIES: transposase [Comamonas]|uniref:transposase n=1 Tax=Comamonas TaxID=283 RepID=UPI0009B917DB